MYADSGASFAAASWFRASQLPVPSIAIAPEKALRCESGFEAGRSPRSGSGT
jgi:hypothetical protein